MKRKFWAFLLGAFASTALVSNNVYAGMATMADRANVNRFITNMSDNYGFNPNYLANLFDHVKIQHGVLAMLNTNSSHHANPWYNYRNYFITARRVQDGVNFWNQHQKTLAIAEKKYGVPANIIVAIIGVETHYGTFLGHYRVLDTLFTLSFYYPRRENYFRHELAQYLLLSREDDFNPLAIRGSYEGAIGMPQFMPSSYRRLGLSYDGNKKPNLLTNPDDAIISVANYFKNYGWVRGQPVVIPAVVSGNQYSTLLNHTYHPKFTVSQLATDGIKPSHFLAKTDKANLFRLEIAPNDYHYWLGLNNFYVITAYNPNIHYAMAVYELGQKIQEIKNQEKNKITLQTPE